MIPCELEQTLAAARSAPKIFISVTEDRARAESASSEMRRELGAGLGSLDGATVSWKDMIAVADVVMTAGSATRRNLSPEPVDALLVARGVAAGLITIGTTNMSEFAFSGIGHNPHFGTPLINARVPGGSSSGAAASVARRIVRLAVGTDTAGSCRVPAAFHGLFGFRPTRGRYPMRGILPLAPDYDTAGLITGSARDLLDLDTIMSEDTTKAERTLQIVLDRGATDQAEGPITLAIREALASATAVGFFIREVPSTILSKAISLIDKYGWPGGADAAQTYARLMESDQFAHVDPLIAARLRAAAEMEPQARGCIRKAAATLRAGWPSRDTVLALPTVAVIAPEAEPLLSDPQIFAAKNSQVLRLTMPASLLDLPALSLPIGNTGPDQWCGLQLVGPPGSDRALLALACRLEARNCTRGALS
ncbi:amidase family protein [Rhizobium sp. PAMB 3182]